MDDQHPPFPKPNPEQETPGQLRSPVRPPYSPPPQPAIHSTDKPTEPETRIESPTDPGSAMNTLRRKMERLVDEYATGKINRVQFNALYSRYNEQRSIIEKIVERNPQSDAWKQVVGNRGQTGFLRAHFEAQAVLYAIYMRGELAPLVSGGRRAPDENMVRPLLAGLWKMQNRPPSGLGRKTLSNGEWLILALGEHSTTIVVFSLEPSNGQAVYVRDLHGDFEKANRLAIARGTLNPERLVFPQRALTEKTL